MAFTLVVEDGSGKSTANTYLAQVDATTYHEDHSGSSDWVDATSDEKNQALILATQCLDIRYEGLWLGVRSNEDQALDWPRSSVEDVDGYVLDSDALPQKLEDATAELALRVITETDGILPDFTDSAAVKKEKVKIGPIESDIEYAGGEPPGSKFVIVDGLIKGLILSGGLVRKA